MKIFCLSAFFGLAVVFTGCGVAHSMVQENSSSSSKAIQPKDFSSLGKVAVTSDGIELTIPSNALFKKRSTRLTKSGIQKIDSVTAAILKYPDTKILVTGYTDNSGTDMQNVSFSQNQANRVMVEMIRRGVLAAYVNAEGSGPVEPIAPNNSAQNREKNHRIVFEIKNY